MTVARMRYKKNVVRYLPWPVRGGLMWDGGGCSPYPWLGSETGCRTAKVLGISSQLKLYLTGALNANSWDYDQNI